MANRIKEQLKIFFQTNKKPTQEEFEDLIDSSLNILDDKASDSDAQNESIDDKYLTPKTAKKSVVAFAPVKSVNGNEGHVTVVNITGNAAKAAALLTPRTINGIPFDGTSNIVIPTGEGNSNKYFTDFLQGPNIQFPFTLSTLAGGGALVATIVAEMNHPGQILLKKSATVNSGYHVGTHPYSMLISPSSRYEVITKFSSISADKLFRFGFSGSTSITEPANGAYFEFINGSLFAKTVKTSVRTSNTLFTPSANTWYHFIVYFEGLTSAKFEVYSDAGVLLASTAITTNVPNARVMGALFVASGTSAVEEDLCVLDYISLDLGKIVRGKL